MRTKGLQQTRSPALLRSDSWQAFSSYRSGVEMPTPEENQRRKSEDCSATGCCGKRTNRTAQAERPGEESGRTENRRQVRMHGRKDHPQVQRKIRSWRVPRRTNRRASKSILDFERRNEGMRAYVGVRIPSRDSHGNCFLHRCTAGCSQL